ncbi:MAG TPA: hypothetical protein VFZ65_09440 [Planctomycetota bacterium]|nr:hypothetical protein [Planctomycetota bacterium]
MPTLLLLTAVAAGVRAQDDVLAVERRGDVRAHAAAVRLLKNTRARLRVEDVAPDELCGLLAHATGDKLSFVCCKRDEVAAARVTLQLGQSSLWTVLAATQLQTGLRFVFRSGVVFLTTADDVKPLAYLQVYDLRSYCAPLRSFPGPDLRLRQPGDDRPLFPEEVDSGETVSGFTADGIEALLRETVRPESWASPDVSLSNHGGLFLVRQTPAAHREIENLLAQLGLWTPRRIAGR